MTAALIQFKCGFKMFFGYLLYILITVYLGHTHVLPKGFHLSNSCQPRCQSGTTCVVYRTSDGNPKVTCKYIDPHNAVLDGSLIITSPNIDKPLRDSSVTNTNTEAARGQITDIFETLIKELPDAGLETVKAVNTGFKPRQPVKDRMPVISDLFKHDLQEGFRSLGKRPELFSSNDLTRNTGNSPSFQNFPSTVNKESNKQKSKFEGLTLVRTADGGLAFRRTSKAKSPNVDNKLEVVPWPSQMRADSSTTQKSRKERPGIGNTTSRSSLQQHSEQKKTNAFTGNSTVCTPCNPEHTCPPMKHCYFSATCARQICQRLFP
ncbi:uncharacterized protein LOC123555333 [Mercenaria mercenaria]|uniref:uncharacterized protein LOC123555333 n=1 Tax=Mercenaria mercenaria TaxID=6596 RepID=UPI00234F98A5|nr:uncharacterized protein LOC123555333 [Mercenaria mercenaria]